MQQDSLGSVHTNHGISQARGSKFELLGIWGAAWWPSHGAWAALELAAKARLYFAKTTMPVGFDACQPRMADSEANFLTLTSGLFFFPHGKHPFYPSASPLLPAKLSAQHGWLCKHSSVKAWVALSSLLHPNNEECKLHGARGVHI